MDEGDCIATCSIGSSITSGLMIAFALLLVLQAAHPTYPTAWLPSLRTSSDKHHFHSTR